MLLQHTLLRAIEDFYRELAVYLLTPTLTYLALRLVPALWTPLVYASCAIGLPVVCVFTLGYFLYSLLPDSGVSATGKSVLITGCDTGFGHRLAIRLDRLGFQVFAGCLFPHGEGAKSLQLKASSKLHVVPLNVTKDEDFRQAVDYVRQNLDGNGLWAVVANAGVFGAMELEWWSITEMQQHFDINVFGCVRTVQAFLPLLRQSKGRIVLTASYAGRATASWNNVYSMTKHAVISLGDGLRRELMKWGISVILVEPTYYKTAILPKPENIVKKYKESNLPQEVKEAYGDDYVSEMADISVNTMAFFARDNVDEVVDTLEKAVCARHPRQMYRCDGFVRWLLVVVFLCFPLVFQDLLDYLFLHHHAVGPDGKLVKKPSVLERVTNKVKSILAPEKLKK
ncbi:retinol dehydrogenase 5-like isoform X1 [Dermacentor andersoni]|uniref:retinol dehydrogenase 5-like isoform X1 n=1 Tax=Dermacentor andersoni TaxID=34620 RepID=UPI003B3A3425